jgi:hypothetical protein
VAGPLSNDVLPQTFAGGELGHEPLGTGCAVTDVVGTEVAVDVVGAAVVVVVGAVVVGTAVVVAIGGAVAVVVGTTVVAVGEAVVVVVGTTVVAVGEAVVVVVGGEVVVVTRLATVKSSRLRDVVPFDNVIRALMLCDPSASFVVSYGSAVPSAAVPAKSKGGFVSVRTGSLVLHERSR